MTTHSLSPCVKNCSKASFNNCDRYLHLIDLCRSMCEDENNEKLQGMVDQRFGGPSPSNPHWWTWYKQSQLADLAQTISRFVYAWYWKQNPQCVSIFVDFSFVGISWILHWIQWVKSETMHLFLFVEDCHLTAEYKSNDWMRHLYTTSVLVTQCVNIVYCLWMYSQYWFSFLKAWEIITRNTAAVLSNLSQMMKVEFFPWHWQHKWHSCWFEGPQGNNVVLSSQYSSEYTLYLLDKCKERAVNDLSLTVPPQQLQ